MRSLIHPDDPGPSRRRAPVTVLRASDRRRHGTASGAGLGSEPLAVTASIIQHDARENSRDFGDVVPSGKETVSDFERRTRSNPGRCFIADS